MTESSDDRRLKAEFTHLRSEMEAAGTAPDFESMMARAREEAAERPSLRLERGGARPAVRSVRRSVMIGGWATAAAAAAVAAILLTGDRTDQDAAFEALVAAYSSEVPGGVWRSPTSGLLAVPGMDLTRSVPSIGGAARGLDPSLRPATVEPNGRDS